MNFDRIIDRSGSNALKLELRKKLFGREDVLPLWVADMDFPAPLEVSKAIQERATHPLYGYTARDEAFYDAIVRWLKERHQWEVEREWLEYMPGVVPALILAIQAHTQPGDKVVIQPPVYPPFFDVVKDHDRIIEENPLVNTPDGYRIDFEHLDQVTSDSNVKMLLFCHPHNPVGRVWTKDELQQLSEICLRNNVMVVSDEIHADLTLFGHKHTPLATLGGEIAENTITLMAPSKTFNIAGLNTAYMVAPNREIWQTMHKKLYAYHLHTGNMFGAEALKAAYHHGHQWLDELLTYIEGNTRYVIDFIRENMPEVKVQRPEATYLIWLDFSAWNMSTIQLKRFIVDEAGLGLNNGPSFGKQGMGFQRLNVASPRQVIEEAMKRLLNARNQLF
ncbi:MAG: MalY/PatB family protein [Marinilabilia sp.]